MNNSNQQPYPQPLDAFLAGNPQAQSFFMSLPAYVQENLHQSGVQIQSEEELRQCADHLMKKS